MLGLTMLTHSIYMHGDKVAIPLDTEEAVQRRPKRLNRRPPERRVDNSVHGLRPCLLLVLGHQLGPDICIDTVPEASPEASSSSPKRARIEVDSVDDSAGQEDQVLPLAPPLARLTTRILNNNRRAERIRDKRRELSRAKALQDIGLRAPSSKADVAKQIAHRSLSLQDAPDTSWILGQAMASGGDFYTTARHPYRTAATMLQSARQLGNDKAKTYTAYWTRFAGEPGLVFLSSHEEQLPTATFNAFNARLKRARRWYEAAETLGWGSLLFLKGDVVTANWVEQTLRVSEWSLWLRLVQRVNPSIQQLIHNVDTFLGPNSLRGGPISNMQPVGAEVSKALRIYEVPDSQDGSGDKEGDDEDEDDKDNHQSNGEDQKGEGDEAQVALRI
ncbi:hypothetical protein PTMSG1_09134 [Pyrenophora teres f. maculata]|nr:hypothetical protein PTMSG1_09134 [Pyrenophora teres f. maculata]